jgi:hypothetical protein
MQPVIVGFLLKGQIKEKGATMCAPYIDLAKD